ERYGGVNCAARDNEARDDVPWIVFKDHGDSAWPQNPKNLTKQFCPFVTRHVVQDAAKCGNVERFVGKRQAIISWLQQGFNFIAVGEHFGTRVTAETRSKTSAR